MGFDVGILEWPSFDLSHCEGQREVHGLEFNPSVTTKNPSLEGLQDSVIVILG